jgi:hypothetical protein
MNAKAGAVFSLLGALLVVAMPASAQRLTAEQRRVIDAIPDEGTEPPGEHYYRSNEWRQDLLRAPLRGRGGAYIGVGSDQNYTMAAMAGAEYVFLVDYDPFIPWIHAIYEVLVKASETPEALIARFSAESEAETTAMLSAAFEGRPRARRMIRHFTSRRAAWEGYLVRVSRLERDGEPFSWLADPEMYRYTRRMFTEGRMIHRNGDVTTAPVMEDVAAACRRLGTTVRVVYFSNAEQFFQFTDQFIANMKALPIDDRAVVVRTIRHRNIQIAEDGQWHYLIHDFPDFVARLDTGAYRRVFSFTTDLLAAGPPHLGDAGISTLTAAVPQAAGDALRERRRQRRSR